MPIQAYVQHHLIPHLGMHGLDDRQIRRVAADVFHRLASLLCRWNECRFRRTLLILGEEEATFWEPAEVDLAVRCLVVVAIRNSLLEDLASTAAAARTFGLPHAVLPDGDIPTITREAIRYFAGVDLARACHGVAPPPIYDDVFGDLPVKYPAAWRALGEASLLSQGAISYPPVPAYPPPLPIGRPADVTLADQGGARVVSGMATEIEPGLQRLLRLMRTGLFPGLFADSFKMITRNPEKLFAVMEFVFAHDRALVTHNYYLRNGYVVRRTPLLRPAHTLRDAHAKFVDPTGLLPCHAEAIAKFAPSTR